MAINNSAPTEKQATAFEKAFSKEMEAAESPEQQERKDFNKTFNSRHKT